MATSAHPSQLAGDAAVDTTAQRRTSRLRRNANLTRELAITQFKLKYTGSVLGYVWSLVKPLMLFATMYIVFAKLFHTGRGSTNFTLQLLLAVVLWTFFADSTSAAMNSIASNGSMIRKAYFPRIVLVIAATLTSLMTFAINLSLIILVAAPLHKIDLGLRSLVTPLLLVELYALVLGLSLILGSLFVYYRDLGHIWEIVMQVLLYASTVLFPITLIPDRFLVAALSNPVAQIIEDARHALVTPDVAWTAQVMGVRYLIPLAITAAILGFGVYLFNRLTPRFAEFL